MKYLFYRLILLVPYINGYSQHVIDTTYNTTYYEQKVTLFNLLPDNKNEIIFLGNSITDIGEWAEIWNNKHVINRGISGDNTFGVLARLPEIVSAKPKKIFLMIGINDIAKNTPDTVILNNYKKIISEIQASSTKTAIVVQSILPTNNDFSEFKNHQHKDGHIKWLNKEIKAHCQLQSIRFVNLYDAFTDGDNKLSKQFTNDGLHLNGQGYMLWKKILQQEKLMK